MPENPYKVLGIPVDCEFNEVRARYFYLAKKHHPDKLGNVPEEERKRNEEYFKNITVAYHEIDKKRNNKEDDIDLNNIWRQVETFFNNPQTWECMKDILKKVSKMEKPKKVPRKHHIKVDLTLEDVHNSKDKKLRLFLAGIEKPVYITIQADTILKQNTIYYNNYLIEDNVYIDLTLELVLKKHKFYRIFRLMEKWDVFNDISINLMDYVTGKEVLLTYLDGRELTINIPAYYDTELPIIVENQGLCGKGDLFIKVKVELPKNILEFKENLGNLNALVIDPGVPAPKTI